MDRINGEIEKTNKDYRQDTTNWEEFFEDIIGVSKDPDKQIEEVKLLFNKEQAPYIQTKPLHGTQKNKLKPDGSLLVEIEVVINYELEMRILSFGEKVKVIAPENLVTTISNRIHLLSQIY